MLLDTNDLLLIDTAISKGGKSIWDDNTLNNVKKKIKDHYRGINGGKCCYCRKCFVGEFSMVIDIEHVLPKSIFPDFIFDSFNLNIACKRCNMSIKGQRTDFLVNEKTIHLNPQQSDQYKFIHPNLDNYEDNLQHLVVVIGSKELIKYIPRKPKGTYTYEYFKLEQMEINSFDAAQGISFDRTEFSTSIPNYIVEQLLQMIDLL